MAMEHHHFHWLEKLQVQIITIAGLFAVYFLAWPVVRPADPLSPVAFLPLGDYGCAVGFAAVFCVLVAVCAVATVAVRPVAALLAATLAAGGVSLRSPQIRALLWARQGDMAAMYGELMLEAVMLAMLAALASLIVVLVRRAVRAVKPDWLWRDPMADLTEAQHRDAARTHAPKRGGLIAAVFGKAVHEKIVALGTVGGGGAGRPDSRRFLCIRSAACALLAGVVAVLLLLLLLRSADRGQIIFALIASFTIGVFVAQQAFPSPHGLVAMVLPMLTAVGFYAVGWAGAVSGQAADWTTVSILYRALPIDWFTAGGGGALLGFWISQRVHEFRHVHQRHEQGDTL